MIEGIKGIEGIELREASRQFGVPLTTLRNWRRAGLLRTVREQRWPGYPVEVATSDVKAAAAAYHAMDPKRRRGRNALKALRAVMIELK